MDETVFQRLPEVLLPWYDANKRELPWRQDRNPYHVWISEIMLQQTRVEAVKGYYSRFLQALPDISSLAKADDELLHKLWEGLGYYNRVRNLKKAAQVIVDCYGGVFPQNHAQILDLPGIGPYTAGAIASIAFNEPKAAVDGNVLRLVARLTEDATPVDLPAFRKNIQQELERVYPQRAGDFTQALMELGATLCGPNGAPDCQACPCREFCAGAIHNTAEKYPVKSPKKDKRQEKRTVYILSCQDKFALSKRPESGLLAGLWEFPNESGHLEPAEAVAAVERMGLSPRQISRQLERQHIFTHIKWEMRGFYMEVTEPVGAFVWLTAEQIDSVAALPTAFRQFWEDRDV